MEAVIARSESDEAIHSVHAAQWIASLRSHDDSTPTPRALAADLGADDVAEQVPFAVLELHHLELFDRGKVGGAGVDLDAGKRRIRREVFQAGGLLHHVFPGQVVA